MPKIIGGSLQEHRTQTRLRLFAALSDLMQERGFDAISFAQIAKTANVGRTAVYNHFADKEALLLGYIQHETENYAASLQRSLVDVQDPEERLRAYIQAQARLNRVFHMTPGTELRSVLSRSSRERLREHVDVVEQILREILIAGIRAGAFPTQDVDITVSLINSCLSGRTFPEPHHEREESIKSTELFVLRAVGAKTEFSGNGQRR